MEFSGKLIKIFYEAEAEVEPKFRIGIFFPVNNDDGPSEIIIKGNWDLVLGIDYIIRGNLTFDQSRNQNCLSVDSYHVVFPTSPRSWVTFLASDLFPSINRSLARTIIEEFLDQKSLLDFLINNQKLLIDKLKLTPAQAEKIINEINVVLFEEQAQAKWNLIKKELEANNIKTNFLKSLLEHLSLAKIVATLKKNPYELGLYLRFKLLDQIFLIFHHDVNHPLRISYWLEHIVDQFCQKTGNTKIKTTLLQELIFKNMQELTLENYNNGFKLGLKYKLFYQINEYVVLAIWWYSNHGIINNLKKIAQQTAITNGDQLRSNYKRLPHGKVLTAEQFSSFSKMLTNNITILTGGPGTGKTQIIKTVINYLQKYHPEIDFILAAPTGKAAQNLYLRTGVKARTLHSVIGWRGNTNSYKNFLKQKPLHNVEVLIIDEFSMVSNWLFGALLQSIVGIKHLILIGDPLQLPSIQPGAVLRDLISAKSFAHDHLLEVFRQAEGSAILKLIKFMESYQNPDDFETATDFDFKKSGLEFKEFTANSDIEFSLLNNYRDLLASGLDQIYDMQVIIPQRKNKLGTEAINELLQANFNPNYTLKSKITNYNHAFFLGDKVMQIKNDYDRHVMNGNIGKVCHIYKTPKKLTDPLLDVQFLHKKVSYNKQQIRELDLAYACTVHKVQGSEFPAVIGIISQRHAYMLKFKLIYTMISRAQNHLILIGQKTAMMQGLERKERPRQTLLLSLIKNTFKISQ